MDNVIVVREYRPNDTPFISELVKNAYLSNVSYSWWSAITKEITFQLIVMSAAIMFIFMGIPLQYCFLAVPFVSALLYMIIYSYFLIKAMDLMHSKRLLNCWVAEVFEPYFNNTAPETLNYRIIDESKLSYERLNLGKYQKKIVGTVAVARHIHDENGAWLFRLAVDQRYRRKGIGYSLVVTVQNWCRLNHYDILQLAMSECQEYARQLFVNAEFDTKQMYHKPLLGNGVTLLMYHLECKLDRPNF